MPTTRKPRNLTAKHVEHAAPGKHSDGGGLSLIVKQSGARSWVVRLTVDGKQRDAGIGGWPQVSLAEARQIAARMRAEVKAGDDPIADRSRADMPTFEEAAKAVYELLLPSWRNPKQPHTWWRNFELHAAPIMDKRVDRITRADVLDVLEPVWQRTPETGRRLRQQIRRVLAWAMARHEHIVANAAGEALDGALIGQPRSKRHQRSVHYSEMPEVLAIVDRSGAADATRLAYRWLVLTATRSIETREAVWSEINWNEGTWEIPGSRMKAGKPHRVPLSRQAIDVLAEAKLLPNNGDTNLIFPSYNGIGRPITDQGLRELLNANAIDASPHGARSSFRQWALEQPGVSWAACELALAHSLGTAVVQAYVRDADLLEERRALMQQWADYVAVA